MMSDNWLNENSGGSGNPGVHFGVVGEKVVGRITQTPKTVTTQFGERLVVELEASEQSTASKGKKGGDGRIVEGDNVTLWLKPGAMAAAVRDAINSAEARGLSEGDTLALAFTGTKDTGKAEPVKLYTAQLVPAKPAVAVGESLI
jgi:hypothetical protein